MPTLTLKDHKGGVDLSAAPNAIADGKYVSMANRRASKGVLEARPGQTRYLTTISPNLPGTGLARFSRGGDAPISQTRVGTVAVNDPTYGAWLWTNPGNVFASDDTLATAFHTYAAGEPAQSTQLLKTTGYGFTIPSTATVTGIRVEVERRSPMPLAGAQASWGGARDSRVWIVKAGAVPVDPTGAQSKHASGYWPTADAIATYGDDLWSQTWTPAQINDVGFGVAIAALLQFGATSSPADLTPSGAIDLVRITVFYTTVDTTRETLLFVGANLYSDKTGAWATINGASTLQPDANMEILLWKGIAYIQDGLNGPYKYDGTTFSTWTGANAPPVARYMLLDIERIYAAGILNARSALRACTLDNADDWPAVAKPGGDDGMLMYVGRDDGDFITGLGRLGTEKYVFKRRLAYRLRGDNADTWDLGPKPILRVGCIAHRTIQECGNELCWSDGRHVYSLGPDGLDITFGKPIEPLMALTPLATWQNLCAVFVDNYYVLWYAPTAAVAFDFTTRAWYGPWFPVPTRVGIIETDTGQAWLASSMAGEVNQFTGSTDNGVVIPWDAESKHYDLNSGLMSRPRRAFITADGEVGTVIMTIIAEGGPAQLAARTVTRTFAFAGTGPQTRAAPVSVGADGVYLGIKITGPTALGRVYEYGLRADALRAR